MTRPSISVAMCTYNGARFVREQLHSIAQQTTLPDELVVCDDASTDQTAEILADFARGSQVRVAWCATPTPWVARATSSRPSASVPATLLFWQTRTMSGSRRSSLPSRKRSLPAPLLGMSSPTRKWWTNTAILWASASGIRWASTRAASSPPARSPYCSSAIG